MPTTLLTTHHVGARAGTRTFPVLKYFEKDIVNVLYEADESAISGIKKDTHRLASKTVILPDCLSGNAGKRNFYIYNNRYFSSLYPLKADQTLTYSFDRQFGWGYRYQSFITCRDINARYGDIRRGHRTREK